MSKSIRLRYRIQNDTGIFIGDGFFTRGEEYAKIFTYKPVQELAKLQEVDPNMRIVICS